MPEEVISAAIVDLLRPASLVGTGGRWGDDRVAGKRGDGGGLGSLVGPGRGKESLESLDGTDVG